MSLNNSNDQFSFLQNKLEMEQASNQSQLLADFSCEQCNIELPTMSDLKNHLLNVHPNSKKAKELNPEQEFFECEFCHKKFTTKTL